MKNTNAKAFLIRHCKLAMDIVTEMDTLTPNQREVKARQLSIRYKKLHVKNKYGHELLEPANQYCKHCGLAMFTQEYKTPCTNILENNMKTFIAQVTVSNLATVEYMVEAITPQAAIAQLMANQDILRVTSLVEDV